MINICFSMSIIDFILFIPMTVNGMKRMKSMSIIDFNNRH